MKNLLVLLSRGVVCRANLLAFVTLASTLPVSAATLLVSKTGADTASCGTSAASACLTIQYTLDNRAHNDDQIIVEPGTYKELLSIHKRVTVNGQKKGAVTISGEQLGTTVSIVAGASAELEYLTITGGAVLSIEQPFLAGGIGNGGTLALYEVSVEGNSITEPDPDFNVIPITGGIENNGTLNIYSSTISANSSTGSCYSVGGILNDGTLSMDLSAVDNNSASQNSNCDFGPGGVIGATDGF